MTEIGKIAWASAVKYMIAAVLGASITLGSMALSKAQEVDRNTAEVVELKVEVSELRSLILEMVKFNAVQVEINAGFREHVRGGT